MKHHQYMLIVRRSTDLAGEIVFARSYAVRAEIATDSEMDAEALDALADEVKAQARLLRSEKTAA